MPATGRRREPIRVLTVRDSRAGYGDEDILHGVSIDVPRGAIVAVIGPNGSGKSTLLKTIYGLVPARRRPRDASRPGRAGRSTSSACGRTAITALGVNMVPQLANVFPEMSVRENLEIGALPMPAAGFDEQLEKVLAHASRCCSGMLGKRAATLSGGQRQMLGVGARADVRPAAAHPGRAVGRARAAGRQTRSSPRSRRSTRAACRS